MAYPKYQGYQYETSPRKLQPEYERNSCKDIRHKES